MLVALALLPAALIDPVRAAPAVTHAGNAPSANGQLQLAVATPVAGTPLVVDGDPITTLVSGPPEPPAISAVGSAGLYRSHDGGQTWEVAGPPPPPGRIVAAQDDPLLLLAGDHPPCARGGEPLPLHRSSDGGATWQAVAGVVDVRPLAIWRQSGVALGARCAGLQLSTDAGLTWQTAPLTSANYDVTAFAALSGAAAAAPAGLVVGTSEGGTSQLWRLDLAAPAPTAAGDSLTTFWGVGAPAGRDRLYLVGTAVGILVSADGGTTWQQSRTGLEEVTISVDPFRESIPDAEFARGFGIDAVAIDPAWGEHLYAGTVGGLYESVDQGATWQRVAGVDGHVTGLVLAPSGGRLFAQTATGVVVAPLPS